MCFTRSRPAWTFPEFIRELFEEQNLRDRQIRRPGKSRGLQFRRLMAEKWSGESRDCGLEVTPLDAEISIMLGR